MHESISRKCPSLMQTTDTLINWITLILPRHSLCSLSTRFSRPSSVPLRNKPMHSSHSKSAKKVINWVSPRAICWIHSLIRKIVSLACGVCLCRSIGQQANQPVSHQATNRYAYTWVRKWEKDYFENTWQTTKSDLYNVHNCVHDFHHSTWIIYWTIRLLDNEAIAPAIDVIEFEFRIDCEHRTCTIHARRAHPYTSSHSSTSTAANWTPLIDPFTLANAK